MISAKFAKHINILMLCIFLFLQGEYAKTIVKYLLIVSHSL